MGEKRIYLERINVMACRYSWLVDHDEFRFIDDVAHLHGDINRAYNLQFRAKGIFELISLAFGPEVSENDLRLAVVGHPLQDSWGNYFDGTSSELVDSNRSSIIELDFQAGGKRHLLYRCFRNIENHSTNLTIFENDSFRELDDKEALDYLDQITLPHRLGYEEMSHRITKGYRQMNPGNVERLMNLINTWNCNMNSYIKHLYWHDGQISFVDRNGSNQRLELANEELQSVICNMVTLAAIVHDKSEDEITKVVLFDNVKWFPNEYRPDPIELIKALSDKHGIQFITIEEIPRVSKIIKQSIIR